MSGKNQYVKKKIVKGRTNCPRIEELLAIKIKTIKISNDTFKRVYHNKQTNKKNAVSCSIK